jgi:hypothetical protein
MAAQTASQKRTAQAGTPSPATHKTRWLDVKAATALFQGSMVMEDYSIGFASKPTSTLCGHQRIVGVCMGGASKGSTAVETDDADNTTGAAADKRVYVEQGIFAMINDTTTACAASHVGRPVYAVDDQTVSPDSSQSNRAIAGILVGFSQQGLPLVSIGPDSPHATRIVQYLANANLSALQNTIVKLASAAGLGKVDAQTNATSKPLGILLNAPTANQIAIVAVEGPAPLISSVGYTCAAQVMSNAAGNGIDGTTTLYAVGLALETAGAAATKMVHVHPEYIK